MCITLDIMPLVFVYGSLKSGEVNHETFRNMVGVPFRYIGEGRVVEKYPFFIFSEYHVPALMDIPSQGKVSKKKSSYYTVSMDSVCFTPFIYIV